MACLLAVFCATAPYARLQLPVVTAFVPIQSSVIVVNDLITATLLAAQFWVVRWTWLLVLASGYFFTALIIIPFVLTFPGVFAPSGILGAGLQTAPWLAICLNMGILVFVIAAILVRGTREPTGIWQRPPGLAIALSIALVTAIVCVLTWGIVAYDEILPRFFLNGIQFDQRATLMLTPIFAVNIFAIVLLWRRRRSVLDLWLLVMSCTWLFEVTLGGLFAGSRYSLGWYTGRVFQIVATYTVLLALLSETTALYANMIRAAMLRRGARHSRQIAMDAMAVSIGHEINQPLMAVVTNAQAGMRQLRKAEPDLDEVQAALSDIAAEGLRIKEIIAGVRTMFKQSAHDRQLLDINQVVRGALAAAELDLHLHRMIAKTELDGALPPILADGGQLQQVFLNLITNAMEAMSGVTTRLCVLTLTSGMAAGTSEIAVTVEDCGIGLPPNAGGRIFEPFFSTKAAGSGVGLAICKVIIEAHGGRLEFRANQPHGTIFRVILPTGRDE
jgi:signal transduction histidine kinase